jgi:uracil-DNA glycosylase family 4
MNLSELNFVLLTCQRCPRLVEWRQRKALEKRRAFADWDYWGKPVPGFGDPQARVFVVGLAPGAHGSNRTGRQFTGDASGEFFFPALYRAGFASRPNSISRTDDLILTDLYTAPICRCVPPENRPTSQEILNCQPFLISEIELIKPRVFVALGRIAFDGILRIFPKLNWQLKANPDWNSFKFTHCSSFQLDSDHWIVASYHPSRQNTQTGRLTVEMFDQVWRMVKDILGL